MAMPIFYSRRLKSKAALKVRRKIRSKLGISTRVLNSETFFFLIKYTHMFNKNTKIRLNDNSGAIFLSVYILIIMFWMLGSVILGTIILARPNRKVKKSDLYPALILCSPRLQRRISVLIYAGLKLMRFYWKNRKKFCCFTS